MRPISENYECSFNAEMKKNLANESLRMVVEFMMFFFLHEEFTNKNWI